MSIRPLSQDGSLVTAYGAGGGSGTAALTTSAMTVGNWARGNVQALLTGAMLQDVVMGRRVVAARSCTIDQISVNVTATGGAGSVIRLGVYSMSTSASGVHSASLLVDAGTVSGTSVAAPTITLGSALNVSSGAVLWFVAVAQVSASTPTITCTTDGEPGLSNSTLSTVYANINSLFVNSVSGALPSTPTLDTTAQAVPLIAFHVSA